MTDTDPIYPFLAARVAGDQERLDAPDFIEDPTSARSPGWGGRGPCPICGAFLYDGRESVTEDGWYEHAEEVHQRTRVVAECEVKRRLITYESSVRNMIPGGPEVTVQAGERTVVDHLGNAMTWLEYTELWTRPAPPSYTARLLASLYSTHSDFRPEWALT